MEYAAGNVEQLKIIKSLFELGAYWAVTDSTYSLEDVVDAHRYVDTGRKKGNVVLRIGE